MKLSLRQRILLTLVPWLALLAVVGGAAIVLLERLGGSIDAILRENYDSVIYMERLKESLERIDSSFAFALAGQEDKARAQYQQQWKPYIEALRSEQGNITLDGEGELVQELTDLTARYRKQGDAFYELSAEDRPHVYFVRRRGGLLDLFQQIKAVADKILLLNQANMEQASRAARTTATNSLLGLWIGLALVAALGSWLTWRTVRAILRPIRALTDSAQAIGAGNLHQVVPVAANDELGQLAGAFNAMARQLRDFRESQQAQLVRVQQTSQATISAFPYPILVVDQEGQVALANPAAQRLFGVAPRERGQPLVPWQPPDPLRQPLADALRQQRDYLPAGFDQTFTLRSGADDHTFLPRVLVIRDTQDQTLGAAVLLEDVTRFRLLDQVKSNLVATVSHELKTPLTGIRLAVHVLLEETVGPLTPKQIELLIDARDNTERLVGMIDNLLDLARLESGVRQLEVRPEQPAELLRAAANSVRPRAEDKGIDLVVETAPDLPAINVDAGQVDHALHNLLDNSLRYTHSGGRIRLTATALDGAVALTVEDTGQGIPADYLPHVFERFFRVPGQSHEGGTGLGLAIVREIVTAHGGTVACKSGVGEGTRVTMRLPVVKPGSGNLQG
jgi:NtrC-family two-component system sensor histidine kinase KinB